MVWRCRFHQLSFVLVFSFTQAASLSGEPGKEWHRFAVYSLGAASNPSRPAFFWLREPKDKGIGDFCDVVRNDIQWYSVPDKALNTG